MALTIAMVQSTPTALGIIPGQGTRDQIANIHWIIEKASEFQKKHLHLLH